MNGILKTLSALGPTRVIILGTVAASLIGFFVFFAGRLGQPNMALLYGNLDLQESAQIVTKLESLNGLYIRGSDDAALADAIDAILPARGPERGLPPHLTPELREKLIAAMPGLKERAKTLVELLDSAFYLVHVVARVRV